MTWVVVFNANPQDRRPVTFRFEDGGLGNGRGRLMSRDDSMVEAVRLLAADMDEVAATPTGPFATPDIDVSHVAYRVVVELGLRAGLTEEQIEVSGDGWQWPDDDRLAARVDEEPVPGELGPELELVY